MLPFYKRKRNLSEKTNATILSMEGSTDQKTDTVEEDIKSVTNDEVVDENETEENDEVPENIRKIKIKRKFCRTAFTKLNNK